MENAPWERLGAGLALALGLATLGLSQGLPRLEGGYPGPSLFPQILGAILTASGLTLLVRKSGTRTRKSGTRTPAPTRLTPLLGMGAFLPLAPWFLGYLGLIPTAALYAVVAALLLRSQWWEALGAGLFVAIFGHLLVHFLGVQG
jgi:putative tricarboxylic transport membrane protein